jgi:hypothetical protein
LTRDSIVGRVVAMPRTLMLTTRPVVDLLRVTSAACCR